MTVCSNTHPGAASTPAKGRRTSRNYRFFESVVSSEIPLPELPQCALSKDPDIHILLADTQVDGVGFKTSLDPHASEGTLSINFTKNGNFDVQPGRYQFVLHGTGVTKYRRNMAAVARAEAEVARINKLIESLKAAATKEQTVADAARTTLEKSRKELAAATADSRAGLADRVMAEVARLESAAKQAQSASEKVTKA